MKPEHGLVIVGVLVSVASIPLWRAGLPFWAGVALGFGLCLVAVARWIIIAPELPWHD